MHSMSNLANDPRAPGSLIYSYAIMVCYASMLCIVDTFIKIVEKPKRNDTQ
jgi:hypothetical protein